MEGGLRIGCAKRVIAKKKKPYRRVKKAVPKVPKALEDLFLSCRETFKGPGTVPSPQDVHKLSCILDTLKPEDLGLSKDLPFFNPENPIKDNPRVTYTTIYQCDNFSLCIFFLPAKGVIPLHNHPEMTVFSKLLLGKMHIKSYDWVDPEITRRLSQTQSQLRLAKLKADNVFTAPCDTSVLYPKTGGNIHEFTAITPCAVLDVIGPPYSKEDGRDCSYYKDHLFTTFSDGKEAEVKEESDRYGWLEEIEMPENSRMDGIKYLGPPITADREL
ncbi:hypothetical protein HN51_033209 [Arachis hypogaea]|uniref:cysteine dioxygenase n=1 Tax=Arachis hypogaea TaxID=3818 RepID=A0A445B1S0_ARAHY|nr:plant cysteine oxidase 2 [Arachis hypogaea]QHO17682.1 Plant cysteine oxidase [Arachis hypogaea]RYR32609.1 hypothetical protein Ahy_A10g047143 [Arachis hypogaea]